MTAPHSDPHSPNPVDGAASPQPEHDAHDASAVDGTAPPATAEPDALQALQAELAALKAQNTELSDQFLRAKAEAENARRRADDEVSKARKFAVEGLAESLLPVADSLEAGLAIQEASAQQIREGAEATLKQLQSALARHKVLPIEPEAGVRFDPHVHQAISMVPADQEPNTVVTVLQKGYQIAERVLRPALVTVAAPR
jgi:molecular chaperone GrpE